MFRFHDARPPRRALALAVMAAVLAGTCPASALADPFNHVDVKYYGWSGCCQFVDEGTSPAHIEETQVGHELGWYSFNAYASPGHISAWGENYLAGNTGLNTGREIRAKSSFDDLVFTDGTGVPKPVTFWVHLDVSGDVAVSYWDDHTKGCLLASLTVRAFPVNDPASYAGLWQQIGQAFSCPYASSGLFAAETGAQLGQSLRVGPFVATSEQPIGLELNGDITPAPTVPWGYPATTVTGRLVATLSQVTAAIESPGFDANSEQAQIVNNVYSGTVSVNSPAPSTLRLAQSLPNPARGSARIAFDLPHAGVARLALFDVAGREIRRLADGWREAGAHVAHWDGLDAAGRSVPPGIYLYRLRAGSEVRTRSMVVTR